MSKGKDDDPAPEQSCHTGTKRSSFATTRCSSQPFFNRLLSFSHSPFRQLSASVVLTPHLRQPYLQLPSTKTATFIQSLAWGLHLRKALSFPVLWVMAVSRWWLSSSGPTRQKLCLLSWNTGICQIGEQYLRATCCSWSTECVYLLYIVCLYQLIPYNARLLNL